jgi:hypothetical protein
MLASLDFQDKAPGAVITVRGGHPDVKPSLVIDVHLAGIPRSFDVAEVVAMPGLVLKPTESARGKPL